MTEQEMCQKAEETAQGRVRLALDKACKKHDLSVCRVVKTVRRLLDAKETKAKYDAFDRKWKYSKPMVAHGPRAKGVDQAIALLDLKPADKHELDIKQPLNVIIRKFAEEPNGSNPPE